MINPFAKRATEYFRDDEAFLAVVTPEPLITFFETPAKEGSLYDRLAIVVGTPGSGKTTIARLFNYATLQTLLRNQHIPAHGPLVVSLQHCRAIENERPIIAGARLPLEGEYREFWEFPYSNDLKFGLMTALLQARTILTWIRNFSNAGFALTDIRIVPRVDAVAALTTIGGLTAEGISQRAREIELAIYKVSAALIPPAISAIDVIAPSAYRPFDVIESFEITLQDGAKSIVKPLIIFDDAQSLHPEQLSALKTWLARRELKVSRWILTRLDALNPMEVLIHSGTEIVDEKPEVQKNREITEIRLQGTEDRAAIRKSFRRMAKDMASRYLRQMEIFSRQGLNDIIELLPAAEIQFTASKIEKIRKSVESYQKKNKITDERVIGLRAEVERYALAIEGIPEEVKLEMLRILLARYLKRTPNRDQQTIFGDDQHLDIDPIRPLTADSEVMDGAKVHLLHEYGRPYYFGLDTICDASSENAEQFLQLASQLVSHSETQIIRNKRPSLTSEVQHSLLRDRATKVVEEWGFPYHQKVRVLGEFIGLKCVEKSLESNAPLGGGASAIGILQEDFMKCLKSNHDLATILKYGVSYNAFSIVYNHSAKMKMWCLIELGGILLLRFGLTLKRGGFIEQRPVNVFNALGMGA